MTTEYTARAAALNPKTAAAPSPDAYQTTTSNHGYYAVLAYARLHGWRMPHKTAAAHGRALAALCRRLRVEIGRVRDAHFGQVNTYPEDVLEQYSARQRAVVPR